jgi:hypothetical protein
LCWVYRIFIVKRIYVIGRWWWSGGDVGMGMGMEMEIGEEVRWVL